MAAQDTKESSNSSIPATQDLVEKNGAGVDESTSEKELEADAAGEVLVTLTVELPQSSNTIEWVVSPQEQIHEVRQSIVDVPAAFQYSCFHLEHNGERINEFVPLSEIPGLIENPKVQLVEDPYTEKEARVHVIRIRELVGAAGERSDPTHGILAGSGLIGTIPPTEKEGPSPVENLDFAAEPSLESLAPEIVQPPVKTVKALSLSPWHPPPCHLRQQGHLLYLVVTTLEGEQHQITAHVGGFYVNKSSNAKFDPFPKAAPKGQAAHSLLTLLGLISPSFSESFSELVTFNLAKDPLFAFHITNCAPAAPWVVPAPVPQQTYSPDFARSQESYLLSGLDNTDTLRDWNEEFQSAKELPRDTVQDRVFRERLTSKLFADYVDAATKGAMLVACGEIAPLNPTECSDAQIFVYNNVFFSFGADGVGTFTSEGGDEAARFATAKDVAGVRLVNQLDIDGLFTAATVVVDYLGKRIVAQSIVPGIFKQREPGENQIDYGAVDGKDIVAADERFVSPFKQLSKALRVKQHPVWDKAGKRFDLEASVETKGLVGTDGRKYVLDLYRITPLDVIWLESAEGLPEEAKYPHRMTVLRPELVETFCRVKTKELMDAELARRGEAKQKDEGAEKTSEDSTDAAQKDGEGKANKEKEVDDGADFDLAKFSVSLNPDAFSGQLPQTDEEKAQLSQDEKLVREACEYVRDQAIPSLLRDLAESDVGFPMDGNSLRRTLHKRGINVRYIGKIATDSSDQRLHCLRDICIQDMVARSFKHAIAGYLRHLPLPLASACISHFLNCLLGFRLQPKPAPAVDSVMRTLYPDADLSFEKMTPENLRTSIEQQVLRRFQFKLASGWENEMKPLQMLREIALKLGLQMRAKDYAFAPSTKEAPAVPAPETTGAATNGQTNGHTNGEGKKKKKNKGGDSSPSRQPAPPPTTFSPEDVLNVVPVVKDSCPRSSLSEEALEAGRLSLMQGQKKLGQDLLFESLSLHEQIYGILHPEVARAYNTLSMLYYQMDEKEVALDLARKAIVVAERTVGVDSAETLLNYLNYSLFLYQTGDTRGALAHIKHALNLWRIIYGPNHPDSITTINNAAVMLQHLKAYHESRLWFEESLRICETIFGKQSVNSATLLFQLAQALALDQDSKGAVNRMRESYNIFLNELGADDKNTKEAESWLEQLTQNAVSIAKQAKDIQARRLRAGVRLQPPKTSFSATAQAGKSTPGSTKPPGLEGNSHIDPRSIDELIKFIEGNDSKDKSAKRPSGRGNPKRRGGAKTSA